MAGIGKCVNQIGRKKEFEQFLNGRFEKNHFLAMDGEAENLGFGRKIFFFRRNLLKIDSSSF